MGWTLVKLSPHSNMALQNVKQNILTMSTSFFWPKWLYETHIHEHLDLFLLCKWGRVRTFYLVGDFVL
jgi:hypothetical protein